MISHTKFEIEEATILRLFAQAGISGVLSARPLGDGEFNAVYLAHTQGKDYVLKIAPRADAPVMTYEQNMMQSEVFWYEQMRARTGIQHQGHVALDAQRQGIGQAARDLRQRLPPENGAPDGGCSNAATMCA